MKRKAIALTLLMMILLSMIVGAQFAQVAKSNPYSFAKEYFGIIIKSPLNETYRTNQITLNITTYIPMGDATPLSYIRYSVDNGPFIDFLNRGNAVYVALLDLPDGSHIIRVQARTESTVLAGWNMTVCGNVTFTIDTSPPSISLLIMRNITYNTANVPLNFTVSEPVSQLSYSLDGRDNVTITGNTTLTGLSDGEHNVTVYATDEAGYTATSGTIYFNVKVAEPQPEPQPFPIAAIIASVMIVIVVSVGLLVYFKRRKH